MKRFVKNLSDFDSVKYAADSVAAQLQRYFGKQYPNSRVDVTIKPAWAPEADEPVPSVWNVVLYVDNRKYDTIVRPVNLMNGVALEDVKEEFDKKLRRGPMKGNPIKALLMQYNIDTTPSKYRLVVIEDVDRKYQKTFTANGDYLAYFAMKLHRQPTLKAIEDYFGLDEFEALVDACPTVEDIADEAASSWWGDSDDYILLLENLTTGEILYESDDPFGEE